MIPFLESFEKLILSTFCHLKILSFPFTGASQFNQIEAQNAIMDISTESNLPEEEKELDCNMYNVECSVFDDKSTDEPKHEEKEHILESNLVDGKAFFEYENESDEKESPNYHDIVKISLHTTKPVSDEEHERDTAELPIEVEHADETNAHQKFDDTDQDEAEPKFDNDDHKCKEYHSQISVEGKEQSALGDAKEAATKTAGLLRPVAVGKDTCAEVEDVVGFNIFWK